MTNRRRPIPPDTRPSWRDPDMLSYELSKSLGMIEMTPAQKQNLSKRRMLALCPDWCDDPTYNLRRK